MLVQNFRISRSGHFYSSCKMHQSSLEINYPILIPIKELIIVSEEFQFTYFCPKHFIYIRLMTSIYCESLCPLYIKFMISKYCVSICCQHIKDIYIFYTFYTSIKSNKHLKV